jgi:hypothetical protein
MWFTSRNHPMALRCRRVGAVHSIISRQHSPDVFGLLSAKTGPLLFHRFGESLTINHSLRALGDCNHSRSMEEAADHALGQVSLRCELGADQHARYRLNKADRVGNKVSLIKMSDVTMPQRASAWWTRKKAQSNNGLPVFRNACCLLEPNTGHVNPGV